MTIIYHKIFLPCYTGGAKKNWGFTAPSALCSNAEPSLTADDNET